MNKLLALLILCILAITLVSGCTKTTDTGGTTDNEAQGGDEIQDYEYEGGEITTLSQDDLNDLKDGLEGLEIEDLGGLSD